jgi:hypothetical protein
MSCAILHEEVLLVPEIPLQGVATRCLACGKHPSCGADGKPIDLPGQAPVEACIKQELLRWRKDGRKRVTEDEEIQKECKTKTTLSNQIAVCIRLMSGRQSFWDL